MLTVAELKDVVPNQHRSKITADFVDTINNMVADPDTAEVYLKNIITYSNVLQEGRFKLNDYMNAVLFVSHKMLGLSSMAAYQRVFPAKCQAMVARNVSQKDMQSYASAFNGNKLVTLIYEQTLIPDHIMYASVRHKAIAAQANLLQSSNEHVVQKAADSLMNHLKAPESARVTLDIGAKDTGVLTDLAGALNKLSSMQYEAIRGGHRNAKQIAHDDIIEGEVDG